MSLSIKGFGNENTYNKLTRHDSYDYDLSTFSLSTKVCLCSLYVLECVRH